MAELEGADDLSAIRAEYQATVGKKPHHSWGADVLREKIEAFKNAPPAEEPTEEPPETFLPEDSTVTVMLMCDHVFLPKDPTQDGWEQSSDTIRYSGTTEAGRRTKLEVHPTLAAFLQERRQAEILD